ncbi:MAG: [FeFe] hydrogenase H-cluster radical SAM maturase HydE [Armatimonadetes bacterium]|nr:[FeFe] hydrogenase H-cluster radical SAM maturase HydE [Armatimonadota bacterium]
MSTHLRETIAGLEAGGEVTRDGLAGLLRSDESTAQALYAAADRVRRRWAGEEVHLRALLEFSNHCRRNCRYCGVRRDHEALSRYRMRPDEIVRAAVEAGELGYRTAVLQSGEDIGWTGEILGDVIREIKARASLAVTLSIGERSEGEYRALREAGADRFLLRIETSSPALYQALHPDSDWAERRACLEVLRRLGYQLGSGVMIGLPGQSPEMLADDLLFLRDLNLDMIGVGPFITHPNTPLAGEHGGTLEMALRFLACLRLLCPQALIPATTAFAALDPDGWERGLRAGADVLMPNVTPSGYKEKYALYPGKVWNNLDAAAFRRQVDTILERIGRHASDGYGHTRLSAAQRAAPNLTTTSAS